MLIRNCTVGRTLGVIPISIIHVSFEMSTYPSMNWLFTSDMKSFPFLLFRPDSSGLLLPPLITELYSAK